MKTVGQVLAEARNSHRITLHEAERATRIRAEILQQIEADNFTNIESPTYIKGFIKNYGTYLGLNIDNLMAVFRRQFDEKLVDPGDILPDFSPKEATGMRITPGRVLGVGVTVLVLSFVGYLLMQYQSFAAAPGLVVSEPGDNSRVNNGTVEAVGRTDRDATLKINGQEVQLTESGAFSVSVTLPDGLNELTFTSINKLGRITTVKRSINVETSQAQNPLGPESPVGSTSPAVAALATPAATLSTFEVTVRVGPNSSYLEITVDGGASLQKLFYPGTSQTFKAKDKVTIRAGNAGSTEVVVNGVDQGKMGAEGAVVTKTFTK